VTQGARIGRADADSFCESTLAGGTHTNCFSNAGALYGYADRGDLYMIKTLPGDFLLVDASGFFRLYYSIRDLNGPPLIEGAGAPVVAEVAYRGDSLPPDAGYFIRCGFLNSLARIRLQLRVSDLLTNSFPAAGSNPGPQGPQAGSGRVSYPPGPHFNSRGDVGPPDPQNGCGMVAAPPANNADPDVSQLEMVDLAYRLFTGVFNKLTGCIPDKAELLVASGEGRVFTVFGNGVLDGALLCEDTGASSLLRIVAVRQGMRGRGTGGRLVSDWVTRSLAAGKRVMRVWTAEDNHSAIRLYERFGFKRDGLKSAVLIKFS